MAWLIGLVVVLIILGVMVGNRNTKPHTTGKVAELSRKTTTNFGGYVIEASVLTREYDRHAYRFDGLAFPQYRITYADDDGVVTERDIYVDQWRERSSVTYYYCWCFMRDERRTFRSDRILEIVNVQTGRRIKDIAAYMIR